MENIKLDPNTIYGQDFSICENGYECIEVDGFLDQIIEDYELYDERIKELEQALQRFKIRCVQLQEQAHALKVENDQMKRSELA